MKRANVPDRGAEFEFVCCDHIRRVENDPAKEFEFTEKSQFTAGQPARVYQPFVQIGEWKMLALCMNCGSRFENNVLVGLLRECMRDFMRELVGSGGTPQEPGVSEENVDPVIH